MKRYSRLVMVLIASCGLFQAGQACAGSQTFVDNTLVFPNYTGTNTTDTIVGPLINSITINWDDNGYLTSIVVNSSSSYYQWDSLFINTSVADDGKWDGWDYLVHSGSGTYGTQEGTSVVPGEGLYSVSENYDYTHSTGRVGHVNGIEASDLTTLENGFHGDLSNPASGVYILTYDFTSLGTQILLGDDFVIGYTPYCANDVILAYGDGGVTNGGSKPGAVPEPATMILLGTGIASLAGWSRHKKKK